MQGDLANELVRRSQKDAFMSKIRRICNNNDNESVTLVSEMDPESDHSVKENAVFVPNRKNASNLEVSSCVHVHILFMYTVCRSIVLQNRFQVHL